MFDPSDRVLVAVMNNQRDFQIARDQRWYRIPLQRAPPSITEAAVLAFYFTRAFEEERWSIHWYAPVEGHELVLRCELLPDELDHPRAFEPYYKLQLGPLMRLENPIYSLRWRRVTFIESTFDRFISAEEINDLFVSGADGMYVILKDAGFWPEREWEVREEGEEYVVDLAIPCRDGVVSIDVTGSVAAPNALVLPDMETVRRAVRELGGERWELSCCSNAVVKSS